MAPPERPLLFFFLESLPPELLGVGALDVLLAVLVAVVLDLASVVLDDSLVMLLVVSELVELTVPVDVAELLAVSEVVGLPLPEEALETAVVVETWLTRLDVDGFGVDEVEVLCPSVAELGEDVDTTV